MMIWPKVKLGEISEVITKGTTPTSVGFKFIDKGINFVKVESIGLNGKFLPSKFASISDECNFALKRSQLCEGDILFSIAGALGRTALVTSDILPANTNQALAIIRTKKDIPINKHYLLFALSASATADQVEKYRGGVAQQNLSLGQLKSFEIQLPPISEQQRIVAMLDEAFADIDKARELTEQNLKNARELFDSYLDKAINHGSSSWITEKLRNLTTKIGSGATPRGGKAAYKKEGISLIRSLNVHDRKFKPENLAFIDDDQAEKLQNVALESGDVLLNITGASVARCCLVPTSAVPGRVNQHVSILRCKQNQLIPEFLLYALTSKFYKNQLLGIGEAGSTRQAITKAQLESFTISFPRSTDEQKQVVEALNTVERHVESIYGYYSVKLDSLNELRKSLLQQAFSGRLIV